MIRENTSNLYIYSLLSTFRFYDATTIHADTPANTPVLGH